MKKLPIIVLVLVISVIGFFGFVAYRVSHGELFRSGSSIRVYDNDSKYEFNARYPSDLTEKLQRFLDARLRTKFFTTDHIDEDLTLDDSTRILVWNSPGKIVIRLSKWENSTQSCTRIRQLAEELRYRLSE
ncbi:MAG: hypothetical protein JO301_16825 [Chitinophagaceae bacterium]|nr:hypothetical protein [Chitinophagaceae bacterium]